MRTDPEMIRRLAGEIDARFRGASVRDVGLLADGRTAIELWSRRQRALLCIDVFFSPPVVTVENGELPIASEPGFIRAAGAALRGTHLLSASARKDDRLLRLTFGTRSRFGVTGEIALYAELVPRFGNLLLVKGDRIVAAAKEFSPAENAARSVQAGQPYELPPLLAHARGSAPFPEGESVLDAMRRFRAERAARGEHEHAERRRHAVQRRLADREAKLRRELASVAAKREAAQARETLREEGDDIYTRLHELKSEEERAEAKERAAQIFARYKKLGLSLRHLDQRESTLQHVLTAVAELEWEAERAQDDAALDDVERALAELEPRRRAPSPTRPRARKRRAPLEHLTPHGSRILIGRSPLENAELTFHVARPGDLWFHAQATPGAHVILHRDDRTEPPPEDVQRAASLAAYYSKANGSGAVAVDYTRRKYVRARRDAPPGLVWYTDFKTISVTPRPL
jgi:predicted ribosome quality control (RQC) complex YloA/Tae2 family protein